MDLMILKSPSQNKQFYDSMCPSQKLTYQLSFSPKIFFWEKKDFCKNLYLLFLRLILEICSISFHQDLYKLLVAKIPIANSSYMVCGFLVNRQYRITSIFINDILRVVYPCLSFAQLIPLKGQSKLFTFFFFPKAIDICLFVP